MRRPGGYAEIVTPEEATVKFDHFRTERIAPGKLELDTFSCGHCGRIVHVTARAHMDDVGSMCRNCMKMVCPRCADKGCTPFLKKLEEHEKRDQQRRLNAQWI